MKAIVVTILNRYTKLQEDVLLGNDKILRDAETLKEICEQNYSINDKEISLQFSLNF